MLKLENLVANVRKLEPIRGTREPATVSPSVSPTGEPSFLLNTGVATVSLPPKNFHAQDLLDAADRCLYASRVSGGEIIKSIEIY